MMIRIIILALLGFLLHSKVDGQVTDTRFGFKSFIIASKQYGTVEYHVSVDSMDIRKPVLIYLDGSGAYPLFQYMKQGVGSTVPLKINELSKKYHIVLISKPGVPMADTVVNDDVSGMPVYKVPETYTQKLSLEWRVNAASTVIEEVKRNFLVDTSRIVLLGISEGFQVGAKVLAINKSITHAILIVGNGLNQLFDFIIQNRLHALQGRISSQEAQQNIDSLYKQYQAIYLENTATDKQWYGHSYLRWASFGNNIPLDNLIHTQIPVLMVAASEDENTSVLSTDYTYLEAIRKGKKNIDYKVYPYNHMMQEIIRDSNGKALSVNSHLSEVLGNCFKWLDQK